jgi:hypothetical protein
MYLPRPGLLIGFHGCEQSVRDRIVAGNSMLNASKNKYDWLGSGFYFWENNYERALNFAKNPPGKKKYIRPSVLGAIIDIAYCLDLLDSANIGLVKKSYELFMLSHGKEKTQIPQNKYINSSKDKLLRELDCTIIENIHAIQRRIDFQPFDSVRGVFVEGEELYPDAGFHDKTHIQICIRNPNCIKGFFIPRQEIEWRG